jgi:uncharacterized phage protein gp47/JayE
MIDRLRLTQPNLDTKEGTVSRDLFVEIQADEFDKLYKSVKIVSDKQTPDSAKGQDVDRWARNYGLFRKTGSFANGKVICAVNDLNSDIPIPSGSLHTAKNGYQFKTIGNYVMSVSEKNKYAANANRLRSALNIAGITDSFVIEIPVAATRPGTNGNISPLQIINSDIADGVKVINLTSFSGGNNSETDSAFKARILAVFSGSNTGTSAGYRNAALGTSGVLDAIVVKPGSTLMLRDGTEIISSNNNSFRIINSGTGGKVDIYVLGKSLEEVIETYIYSDLSGVGDATDERNDFIPGLFGIDKTLTVEERRVKAFEEGSVPLQPIDNIVSVVGSKSGILSQASFDLDGQLVGNYQLLKDNNVSTGGSPFGFDKIRFISNVKDVNGESITKSNINSIDPLRFSGINSIKSVYQDIQVSSENSSSSIGDKSIVILNHKPVLNVSKVSNATTGEIYVIENQNLSKETGLNESGEILISGKTLPSRADILSVDYLWRNIFDNYIDFNGERTASSFNDENVADSIDWGISNGILDELSSISKTNDGFEYTVNTAYNISRVLSVYFAENVTASVKLIKDSDGKDIKGLELVATDQSIKNIISITDSDKVEVYNMADPDGTFSGRVIYLPTNTPAAIGDILNISYNKVEIFDIEDGNGSFSNSLITLPSEDILSGSELLTKVDNAFLVEEEVYVKYVSEILDLVPNKPLSSLPISGSGTNNRLLDSSLSLIASSNQPVFFKYDNSGAAIDIARFGPTRLSVEAFGTIKPGRIKIIGTSVKRYELKLIAGLSANGLTFDIKSALKEEMMVNELSGSIFIARVDRVYSLRTNSEYDVVGHEIKNNTYSFGQASSTPSLASTKFILPRTKANLQANLSSGDEIIVSLLIADSNDSETLYFGKDSEVITDKRFARINFISVSSGFRSAAGNLIGSITVSPFNQPNEGSSYKAVYNFKAPTEGERITVRYNLNKLLTTVTNNIESVRPITADVLVKEAFEIEIDVSGEIIISDEITSGKETILENVVNAVVNLLNASSLGTSIDYSDIITVAASVTGVESVNISQFNESGKQGRKTSLRALQNQSIVAGAVNFRILKREDFRIT